MGNGNFKKCPVCKMERQTTTGRKPALKKHNRWDGSKMVPCEGSGRAPFARTVADSR